VLPTPREPMATGMDLSAHTPMMAQYLQEGEIRSRRETYAETYAATLDRWRIEKPVRWLSSAPAGQIERKPVDP
jgi:hypothetical protein